MRCERRCDASQCVNVNQFTSKHTHTPSVLYYTMQVHVKHQLFFCKQQQYNLSIFIDRRCVRAFVVSFSSILRSSEKWVNTIALCVCVCNVALGLDKETNLHCMRSTIDAFFAVATTAAVLFSVLFFLFFLAVSVVVESVFLFFSLLSHRSANGSIPSTCAYVCVCVVHMA